MRVQVKTAVLNLHGQLPEKLGKNTTVLVYSDRHYRCGSTAECQNQGQTDSGSISIDIIHMPHNCITYTAQCSNDNLVLTN